MSLFRAASTAALTAVLVAGCGGSDSGPHIEPRDGVSVVFEGRSVSDPDCFFRSSEPDFCPNWVDLIIQDVARDGNHIAVLFYEATPFGPGVTLAESDDLGRTWTSRGFGSPPTSATTGSLFLAGGRTYILWVLWIDAPLGGRPIGMRWELDQTGIGHTDVSDAGLYAQVLSTKNGRARTFAGPTDLNDANSGFVDMSWAPGETSIRVTVRCAGVNGCFPSLLSADGQTFVGEFDRYAFVNGQVRATEACTYTSKNDQVVCYPWDTWPARDAQANDPPHAVVDDGNGDYAAARLYALNGHTYAQRLIASNPPTLGTLLDLDLGRPPTYGDLAMYASYRQRFPGMTGVIRSNSYMELYRLRGVGGIDRVHFHDSPCETLESCAETPMPGYGQATYMLPLEGNDALVFYVVDTYLGDSSNHQWIYASRETIDYEEVYAPEEDPNILYPGWRPASPLEAMCTRAASCYPDAGIIATQCAAFWSWTTSASPGGETALARFLATPPGCGGFATTWPEVTVADADCSVATCPGGCDGDAGVQVCRASAPCGITCTRAGGTCLGNGQCSLTATTAECDTCTADGRAVSCGTIDGVLTVSGINACASAGLACEVGPRCVDRTSCPTDGDRCESGTSVQCNSGVESRIECAATGLACAATGQCLPDPAAQACLTPGAECRGSSLYTCPGNGSAWMRVDCPALGFTRCVEDTQTGFGRCE